MWCVFGTGSPLESGVVHGSCGVVYHFLCFGGVAFYDKDVVNPYAMVDPLAV